MRLSFIASLAFIGSIPSFAPAQAAGLAPVACAAGYHTDRHGNCEPNIEQTNPYCPPGLVFHPEFDGWSCNPPPPGY